MALMAVAAVSGSCTGNAADRRPGAQHAPPAATPDTAPAPDAAEDTAPAPDSFDWTPSSEREQFFFDLALAALERTTHRVEYDSAYVALDYPGGDVPDNKGVCADVVVRAFRALDIDLQVDVHEDMKAHFGKYPKRWGLESTDKNIDHRRVLNLMTLFSRKGRALPITGDPADYLPGHIVSWDLDGNGLTHIGIVVPILSRDGRRFLIVHNIGRGPRLEDVLFSWEIIGHHVYFGDREFQD